jgi:hypothetical protein
VIGQLLPVFDDADPSEVDHHNLARGWRLLALRDAAVGRSSTAAVEALRALDHARLASDDRLEAACLRMYCFILDWARPRWTR